MSKEQKHAIGPWKVFDGIDPNDGEPMLSIQENSSDRSDSELSVCGIYNLTGKARDYASLIAAAPDLLTALKAIYNAMDSCVELTPEVMRNARAAIAKATGAA